MKDKGKSNHLIKRGYKNQIIMSVMLIKKKKINSIMDLIEEVKKAEVKVLYNKHRAALSPEYIEMEEWNSKKAIVQDKKKVYKKEKAIIEKKYNDQQRAIWYAYVGNVTAYNLQYEENTPIDFNFSSYIPDKSITEKDAFDELKSLMYNIYTNDGNCFVQQKWIGLMQDVIDRLDDKKKMGFLDLDNPVLQTQQAINEKLLEAEADLKIMTDRNEALKNKSI